MARKVFISSAMSTDEEISEIAEQEPMAALMWPWLLTYFDDWGRAKASPREIKNSVFQANDFITIELIKNALQLYQDKLIQLYEVGGKWYMAIPQDKWFKWQTHIRSHKRENDGSKIPPPPDESNSAQMREVASGYAEVSASGADLQPSPSPSPSLSPSLSKNNCCSSSGENPFTIFTNHGFGNMDELTREFILAAIEDYSEKWVIEAMKESIKQNKKGWKYVERILQRWKPLNHTEPWTIEKQPELKQTNVSPFRRGTVQTKQQIPVAKPITGQSTTSEERLREIREKAARQDAMFNKRGKAETS